ncbi:hypothetical protein JTE90_017915 [Oedothorax gibbosus]|uniref:Uncharacterized protein n=1 Tax=Oedothorax gibbosus TaxID=931172 RepID=A0AAV6VHK6_9ARAC|nr:hypothetical protein JTE90_017915 [Oedothorax gibbosus]
MIKLKTKFNTKHASTKQCKSKRHKQPPSDLPEGSITGAEKKASAHKHSSSRMEGRTPSWNGVWRVGILVWNTGLHGRGEDLSPASLQDGCGEDGEREEQRREEMTMVLRGWGMYDVRHRGYRIHPLRMR